MTESAQPLFAGHAEFFRDASPTQSGIEPRTRRRSPARTLSEAAFHAEAESAPCRNLAVVWQDVIDGKLEICGGGQTSSRHYAIARTRIDGDPRRDLGRIETAVVARVLWGDQQKCIAADLSIACSTTSKWFARALEKLRLDARTIPLPLVLAAQSWASGRTPMVDARSAFFDHEGCEYLLLSVPRPVGPALRALQTLPTLPRHPRVSGDDGNASREALTLAELEIAKMTIDGASQWDIAMHRATSTQTVACQLRRVSSKLRSTGRYALIRHAEESGWFGNRE